MESDALAILVTCEHADNTIPDRYAHLFESPDAVEALNSHRGWDPGALPVAMAISQHLCCPLLSWGLTRLLVESNRSLYAPDLFSQFTRDLPEDEKSEVLDLYYWPYRSSIERVTGAFIGTGHRVLHLAIHSFTDVLNGHSRDMDLGLLFDPDRAFESAVTAQLQSWFQQEHTDLRVELNEPYHGTNDGLTAALRTEFPDPSYAGIEIELRQGMIADAKRAMDLAAAIAQAARHID